MAETAAILVERLDEYLSSRPDPSSRTFHAMHPDVLIAEAKSALEAQRARVSELERERDEAREQWETNSHALDSMQQNRDTLQRHFNDCTVRAEAAEARVSELTEALWQPIESAPKDGTQVDLWGTRNGEPRRFVRAYWGPIHQWGTGDVIEGHDRWHSSDLDLYGEFAFTHWMPIPSPPALTEHSK